MYKSIFALVLTLLLVHCEKSIEPISFQLDISYSKSGAKINRSFLQIYGTGLMIASEYQHSSGSQVASNSGYLTENQKSELKKLFLPFSHFDSYYEPINWATDGDIQTIILITNGIEDTVTVYDLPRANIPGELNQIIVNLDDLLELLIPN